MGSSKIYLGAGIDYENDIVRGVGKDVSSLHVGAQRVAWALLLGDRVGVDIDATVKTLLARYDDEPMAHVTAAVARLGQGRKDDAEKHLATAKEHVRPEHPWSAIVERAQRLTTFRGEERFLEEVPGRVYRVTYMKPTSGIEATNVNVATFLRVKSGDLVYINPVALSDETIARVRELGEVTHIIAPAKYHNEQVKTALETFPKAKAWGVPAHEGYDVASAIPWAGLMKDDEPLFPGEIDQFTIRGVDVGDVWLLDRASKTLIVTDSILVPARGEEYRTPFGAFYAWAWGMREGEMGIPSYQPPMWNDLRAYQASVRRALEQDFEHVASNHAEWRAEGRDKASLQRAYEWFLDLNGIGGVGHIAEFAWRHPMITYRFTLEQIAAAKAKRAMKSKTK